MTLEERVTQLEDKLNEVLEILKFIIQVDDGSAENDEFLEGMPFTA